MTTSKHHYVTFYSPGTLFAETSTKPISEWSPKLALEMSRGVKERYNAVPFAFEFSTRLEREPVDGFETVPKEIARSHRYYINGTVETLADVEARSKVEDGLAMLISNMRCNKWDKIITTRNGYSNTQPFENGAVNLDLHGNVLEIAAP